VNATVIDWAAAVAFVASTAVICWLCRTPKRPPLPQRIAQARGRLAEHDAASARIQADSGLWDGPTVAPDLGRRAVQPHPRWGTDAALLDECSLLLPEYAPGTDRLLQAIHDDKQEGDQP
jgi:hypothetical protein